MGPLLNSYLRHIRGHGGVSPWILLVPLGWFVGACSSARNFAYDHGIAASSESPVPVVSIGNLTHGGTNKTPFVEMLARKFSDVGLTPGIVMRGYGRRGKESLFAGDNPGSRDLLGDEALLLSEKLPGVPVAVAADRLSGVEFLAERGAGVAVADDGFQHRRMGRDVDIVLVDATCPFGNGRLMPDGMLREPATSLRRAHMVVISKADQVEGESLAELKQKIQDLTGSEPFTAFLELAGWSRFSGGSLEEYSLLPGLPLAAFSAIGNPSSFESFLLKFGIRPLFHQVFRDHHRYTAAELDAVFARAELEGAGAMVCTEKDIFNLPEGWEPRLPLFVPEVRASLADPVKFFGSLAELLQPRLVVASNGHGEDAIGSILAEELRERFPGANVSGFSLVGRGSEYRSRGVRVLSPPSETPSGGVVKYRLKDLLGDIRSGLFMHISRQAEAWRSLRGRIRTVICVGDVYLLLHTLWGQGAKPLLVATAKSTRLHGHWGLEKRLLRSRCRRVWTRDPETAADLLGYGVDAFYGGNPIMDLAGDTITGIEEDRPATARVLLLPGSRERAYEDLPLLLEAGTIMAKEMDCSFTLVVASTIERDRLLEKAQGWETCGAGNIRRIGGGPEVAVFSGDVAQVAVASDILIGLGGTANQICAGLGLPVVSIDEKGKRVQKRLLGDAESLVPARGRAMAEEALSILRDPARRRSMSRAGRERMGFPGAIGSVADFVSKELGWEKRHDLYLALRSFVESKGEMAG